MASPMDWTPTGVTRGMKRRSDGAMVAVSPYTPYPSGYVPGGWPAPPPTSGLFARADPESFAVVSAKRLCKGIAKCFTITATFTTITIASIVRGIRSAQLRRPRLPQRTKRTRTPSPRAVIPPTPAPPEPATPEPATPGASLIQALVSPEAEIPQSTLSESSPRGQPEAYPVLSSPSKWPMLQPSFGAMGPPPSPPTIERLEMLEATESSDSESELSSTIDLAWIPSPPGGRPFAVPPSPKSDVSSTVT